MQSDYQTVPASKKALWTGRILAVLLTLFLLMDGVMKLIKPESVTKATMQLGYPRSAITGIGIALLICTILYVIPQTAILGAILLTGYLGGAIASQVRIEASPFSLAFPFIFCVLIWLTLVLRDSRLRVLIPVRR